jgi:ribosomal protein L37E
MCAVRRQARTLIDEDDERYWCSDCGLKTGAQFRLNKHRDKQGPLLAKFECPECSAWWTSAHAYCQNYQVLPQPGARPFFFSCRLVFFVQECKRCGAEAYPFEAQYKTVGTQNQGDPTKRHMAELCERCTSGLTCSAAEAEDRAHEAEVRMTGPTQYAPPMAAARPAAMPRRAAPVTNPWRVPSPTQYTPPLAPPAAVPRAAPKTYARTDEARTSADCSYDYLQSTTSSGTWNRADHVPPQPRTTAPDTGSFCVLF